MNLHRTHALAVVLSFVLVASVQAAALDPFMIDLSGGVGGEGGDTVYTAPNGTVVTSSIPVWNNGSLYNIGYMFNGSLGFTAHTDYWLGNRGAAPEPSTLSFALDQAYDMTEIRVYPYGHSSRLAPSDYQIEVSSNGGGSWTDITGGFIDTSSDTGGTFRDHTVNNLINAVRFTVTDIGVLNGPVLNEIQFFATPIVPEPSSLLLLGLGTLGLVRHARRRRRRA